jgi:hypothetical protein
MPIADTSSSLPVRRRRDESPQQTLSQFRQSGLTQRAFCEQIGLPVSTLQWWLARARREAVTARPVAFTEITMPAMAPPARGIGPEWAVEIVTTAGVTVRLREPLRPATVCGLLRGRRC